MPNCSDQSGLTNFILMVDVCSCIKKKLDDLDIILSGGLRKCSLTLSLDKLGIAIVLKHLGDSVHLIIEGCDDQRCITSFLTGVEVAISACLEQAASNFGGTKLSSVKELILVAIGWLDVVDGSAMVK